MSKTSARAEYHKNPKKTYTSLIKPNRTCLKTQKTQIGTFLDFNRRADGDDSVTSSISSGYEHDRLNSYSRKSSLLYLNEDDETKRAAQLREKFEKYNYNTASKQTKSTVFLNHWQEQFPSKGREEERDVKREVSERREQERQRRLMQDEKIRKEYEEKRRIDKAKEKDAYEKRKLEAELKRREYLTRQGKYDSGSRSKAILVKKIDDKEKHPIGAPVKECVDPAFKKIAKNYTNFIIWRVEALSVVPIPREQFGTFYDEDSYIIYAASPYGQSATAHTLAREQRGGLEYHIHFWLGTNTTPDKAGVAAYKTVEFDSYLGGGATQHREVQAFESPRFKSYFRQGITILKGGTASGFRHVTDEFEPRLYQVKGKRAPIVTQMPKIAWSCFNSGDVFLLHTKPIMFVWVGRAANPIEKLHGTKAAMQLRTEHNTANVVFVDDGYEKTLHDDDLEEWEKYLPLTERFVSAADEVEDDETAEKKHRSMIKLYQCKDHNGKYRVTEIKSGPLQQNDLTSENVYILDHGKHGIWVWVGKRVNEKERTEAMRNARGFVKKKKYPSTTCVTRVVEGAEPTEFKVLFNSWTEKDETKGMGKAYIANKIAKVKVTKFDAATMHERPALAAKSQLIDDGSGTMKIWRLKKFDIVEMPTERYGVFFSGDCYIVMYNYRTISGHKCILYYWLGLHSSQDEQGAAALKTIELDNETGGLAIEVRVTQSREPAHFLQIFRGKLRIFHGKGTDYDMTGRNLRTPNHYLLHILGTTTYDTKATQVKLEASSLNSNYCFVLRKGTNYFIWCGLNSNGDNREMAKGFVGADFVLVIEGNECPEFWNAIGGKGSYISVKLFKDKGDMLPARLFQCSTASGNFKAEEILNFVQTDLAPEDVMLLDAHDTIFLWIGNLSTREEQKISVQTAMDYLKTDPAGRDIKTPIVQIRQGNEPPNFTGFFGVWDDSLWEEHHSYEELRTMLEESSNHSMRKPPTTSPSKESEFNNFHKYPIDTLKAPVEQLPPTVDPLRKEYSRKQDHQTRYERPRTQETQTRLENQRPQTSREPQRPQTHYERPQTSHERPQTRYERPQARYERPQTSHEPDRPRYETQPRSQFEENRRRFEPKNNEPRSYEPRTQRPQTRPQPEPELKYHPHYNQPDNEPENSNEQPWYSRVGNAVRNAYHWLRGY